MKKLRFILSLYKNLFFLGAVSSCLYSALCKVKQVFFVFSPERKLHSVAEPLRFIVLIVCCVFTSTCNDKADNKASQKRILLTISVEKFKQKFDTNEFILIDVKTKKEHEKENIPGSRLIDFYGNGFKSNLNSLDKQKKYLVYCHKGARSSLALRLMNMLEFKEVYELKGGISSWKSAGFKVVRNES